MPGGRSSIERAPGDVLFGCVVRASLIIDAKKVTLVVVSFACCAPR
jgi:hypothetical protein